MSWEEISLVAISKTALILEWCLLLALYVASAACKENLGLRSTCNSIVLHQRYFRLHDYSLQVHWVRKVPVGYLVTEVLLWLKNIFGLAEVTLVESRFVDGLACRCTNFIRSGDNNTVVSTLMRSYRSICHLLFSSLKIITLKGQIGWGRSLKGLRESTWFIALIGYLQCWNISILWSTGLHRIRIENLIFEDLRLVRWGHVYDLGVRGLSFSLLSVLLFKTEEWIL